MTIPKLRLDPDQSTQTFQRAFLNYSPGMDPPRTKLKGAAHSWRGPFSLPNQNERRNNSGSLTTRRELCAARNRVINPQHYDCPDNGHDDAADINTGHAWAT
jgi:hypothetical protein